MKSKDSLTKVLAVIGTVLAWIPILFTLATAPGVSMESDGFPFDYLMPAEFFPAALAGTVLVTAAAILTNKRKWLFLSGVLAMCLFLGGGLLIAEKTGLASGAIGPSGPFFNLVIGMIALYDLTLLGLCIAALFLLKDLFAK
jgi:hypothetical protein